MTSKERIKKNEIENEISKKNEKIFDKFAYAIYFTFFLTILYLYLK